MTENQLAGLSDFTGTSKPLSHEDFEAVTQAMHQPQPVKPRVFIESPKREISKILGLIEPTPQEEREKHGVLRRRSEIQNGDEALKPTIGSFHPKNMRERLAYLATYSDGRMDESLLDSIVFEFEAAVREEVEKFAEDVKEHYAGFKETDEVPLDGLFYLLDRLTKKL